MSRATRSKSTNSTARATTTPAKAKAPVAPPARTSKSRARRSNAGETYGHDDEAVNPPPTPANTSRKRGREAASELELGEKEDVKQEAEPEQEQEQATKRSRKTKASDASSQNAASTKPKSKPLSRSKAALEPDFEAGAKLAASLVTNAPSSPAKTTKANPYNLTPGTSPYSTYPHPTPAACRAVHDALAAIHGTISAPKTISAPSITSSGCGEVPSVLDALVRTRLSAATNGANSSRAFRGLVDHFGTLKKGVGQGSVDWDAVRQADQKDVFECIKSGGLADVKSRDIQKILQLVHDENEAGREAGDETAPPKGVLSLDHLHGMKSEDAFQKLLGYPGVGPKTASCVLLFCMQRPSFAVDTHVFRLTRWLGWTPSDSEVRRMKKEALREAGETEEEAERDVDAIVKEEGGQVKVEDEEYAEAKTTPKSKAKKTKVKAGSRARVHLPPPVTRNSTYSHLDIRIPDELKYPLHYLFIKHGKTCPSCSAKADKKVREEWGSKACPIRQFKRGGGKKVKGEEEEEDDDVKDVEDEEFDE